MIEALGNNCTTYDRLANGLGVTPANPAVQASFITGQNLGVDGGIQKGKLLLSTD